jgi:hypothetical protein
MNSVCCICLNTCIDNITTKCCGLYLCIECYCKLVNIGYRLCPSQSCHKLLEINYKNFNPSIFIDTVQSKCEGCTILQTNLYMSIKIVLRCYHTISIETVINAIKSMYWDINDKKFKTNKIGLNIEQANTLLEICKNKNVDYKLYNLLVAMSIKPWAVSPPTEGRHGLCYHGNFGDSPSNVNNLIELLEYNHKYLIK